MAEHWPRADVQRCTVHKERNLLTHAPEHVREEVKADYRRIVEADDAEKALSERRRFLPKWETRLPAVAKSLEEAGDELLTFLHYPPSQWKCLRTTNALERLNGEFRRRVKVQGSFPNDEAAVALLHALWADGCIKMRKIDGYRDIAALLGRASYTSDRAAA